MKSFLALFKPAPFQKEIADPEVVKRDYHYWRIRILYSMFVGYALFYFTRKSFTFAMPGMIQDLGFEKSQLGILASVFAITYGISKFVSGIISDRSNPRYFMAAGLFITGVLNILFGSVSSLSFLILFWGLNGWFQGFGWPPCAKFLTHWYSHSERGSWWSTWNVSHNIGAFIIPWIAGFSLQYLGWRYAMYFPGLICIAGSFFLVNRLRDTPQSLGLPSIEKFRNDYPDNSHKEENQEQLSTWEILVEHVLMNRYIWMLAFAYFFLYIVRTGINDWTALFLIENKGYSNLAANGCASLFEVGGFFGSLCAGWASDRLFGARRGPVNVIFAICILAAVLFFWLAPASWPVLDSIAMFILGFAIFGPQMLIGVATAELSHKQAAATSTGFAGTFAYIGAAIAGYPLGVVTEQWGWSGFFMMMLVSSAISLLFLLPLWGINERSRAVKIKYA